MSSLSDKELTEILQSALLYGSGQIAPKVRDQIMAKAPSDPIRQWLEDTIAQGAIYVG